jgi:hypothetical protein
LVKPSLGSPDVLNPARQFLKVVERLVGVFQALVVEDKAFDDVLPQALGGPHAELGAPERFHPVAHRDDDIEVVELHPPLHRTVAFPLNCQGFLDSCPPFQFPLFVDVLNV